MLIFLLKFLSKQNLLHRHVQPVAYLQKESMTTGNKQLRIFLFKQNIVFLFSENADMSVLVVRNFMKIIPFYLVTFKEQTVWLPLLPIVFMNNKISPLSHRELMFQRQPWIEFSIQFIFPKWCFQRLFRLMNLKETLKSKILCLWYVATLCRRGANIFP